MTKRNTTANTKKNQLKNRLLCGVGYNTGGEHAVVLNGKDVPAYITWRNMIQRCYGEDRMPKNKSYSGCTVSSDFHDYQDFAEWYVNHEYYGLGYCLDKDIINSGNKIYSPETCCLVPMEINNLFIDRRGDRGELPIGVTHHPKTGKFVSRVSTNEGRIYLGLFKTPNEAHNAYIEFKEAYVKKIANKWRDKIDERVYKSIMSWTA